MKPFLILGANKTGTSTACAIANTHPNIFCLYEIDFTKPADYKRNAEITGYLPECRSLFESGCSVATGLLAISQILKSRGYSFDFVGTKIVGMRPDLFSMADCPTLFVVRDVRLWAAKNRIITDQIGVEGSKDVVPVIASYILNFILSFLHLHVRRVRLDDLFSNPNSMALGIAKFLEIDSVHFLDWWKRSGWVDHVPKNYSNWVKGHSTAFLPPALSDTKAVPARHRFWEIVLPIFDKYFRGIDFSVPEFEVLKDIKLVEDAWASHTMSLNDAYDSFESVKIKKLLQGDGDTFKAVVRERIVKTPGENWEPLD